jgi:hypothetical protein
MLNIHPDGVVPCKCIEHQVARMGNIEAELVAIKEVRKHGLPVVGVAEGVGVGFASVAANERPQKASPYQKPLAVTLKIEAV